MYAMYILIHKYTNIKMKCIHLCLKQEHVNESVNISYNRRIYKRDVAIENIIILVAVTLVIMQF